jgi:antitoxin CcdA
VALAREQNINLSQVSEEAIRTAARASQRKRWEDEHAARIDAFAEWLDENGMPFESLRLF